MKDRVLGWLEDIRLAADDVIRLTGGRDPQAYLADIDKRLAIERQLITLGEAMVQLGNGRRSRSVTLINSGVDCITPAHSGESRDPG